jgi:hypothetical protein
MGYKNPKFQDKSNKCLDWVATILMSIAVILVIYGIYYSLFQSQLDELDRVKTGELVVIDKLTGGTQYGATFYIIVRDTKTGETKQVRVTSDIFYSTDLPPKETP